MADEYANFWDEQDTAETNYAPLVSGKYMATISNASLDMTGDSPRTSIEFTIMSAGFEKRKVWKNGNMDAKGIPFLKQDLKVLGKTETPKSQEDVGRLLSECIDKNCEIFVKISPNPKGGVYENAYLNEVIEDQEVFEGMCATTGYNLKTKDSDGDFLKETSSQPEPSFDAGEELPF